MLSPVLTRLVVSHHVEYDLPTSMKSDFTAEFLFELLLQLLHVSKPLMSVLAVVTTHVCGMRTRKGGNALCVLHNVLLIWKNLRGGWHAPRSLTSCCPYISMESYCHNVLITSGRSHRWCTLWILIQLTWNTSLWGVQMVQSQNCGFQLRWKELQILTACLGCWSCTVLIVH